MMGLPVHSVLIIAAAIGALLLLVTATLIARAGAFSRHVDERNLRRVKFRDDWTDVISAADDRSGGSGRRTRR